MSYLWLQLDENEHAPTSSKHHMNSSGMQNVSCNQGNLDRLEAVTQLGSIWRKTQKSNCQRKRTTFKIYH
jgi:hypothetical protein